MGWDGCEDWKCVEDVVNDIVKYEAKGGRNLVLEPDDWNQFSLGQPSYVLQWEHTYEGRPILVFACIQKQLNQDGTFMWWYKVIQEINYLDVCGVIIIHMHQKRKKKNS